MVINISAGHSKWLAGLIDAEGSFMVKHRRSARLVQFSITMTDLKTMELVGRLLSRPLEIRKPTGAARSIAYSCSIMGASNIISFIDYVGDWLYAKYWHAKTIYNIASIILKHVKDPSYKYKKHDHIELSKLEKKLKKLNKKVIIKNTKLVNYKFSWEWLAGLIDGDGSICFGKWTTCYKPMIKISNNDIGLLRYISKYLNINVYSGGKIRGNRSKTYTIRFLQNRIIDIAPNILPYLITKHSQCQLILDWIKLPRGHKDLSLVQKMHELNQYKYLIET